jgi:hypothetical protein
MRYYVTILAKFSFNGCWRYGKNNNETEQHQTIQVWLQNKKGVWESAFEIFPCDYHTDKLNISSRSLSEIESKIQNNQM